MAIYGNFANVWQYMQIQQYEKSRVIFLRAAYSTGSQMICLTSFLLYMDSKVNNDKRSQHWTKCQSHQTSVQNTRTKNMMKNHIPHRSENPRVDILQSALFPKVTCSFFSVIYSRKLRAKNMSPSEQALPLIEICDFFLLTALNRVSWVTWSSLASYSTRSVSKLKKMQ